MMKVEDVLMSTGVSPRAHNLASSKLSSNVVYASGNYLVVEKVPEASGECGRIISVSECHHFKPVTIVKRAKTFNNVEYYTSGGADGNLNLWKLESDYLLHLFKIEIGDVAIRSLCTAVRENEIVIIAAWGEELSGSLKAWWLHQSGATWELNHVADMSSNLLKRSFILAMDCHIMENKHVLLAVGTSLRKIELLSEQSYTFSMRLSVVGHNDWINSISFNDRTDNLLLASAGQDSFIKLWKFERNYSKTDDNELSVTKNQFTIEDGVLPMNFNVEAVIAGHDDWVYSTEWNCEGTKLISSSSDKSAIIWEEKNNMWTDSVRLGIVGGQSAGFFSAVFTHDGRKIVASSYFGGLFCWHEGKESLSSWIPITMSGGHVGEIRDVSWSPDGHYLLSVGKDQTTRLFALQKSTSYFAEIARPQVHGYDMQCIMSISNSIFVSGGEEKIFRAFRAPETFANSLSNISGLDKNEIFADQILETFGARLPALGLSNKAIDEEEHVNEEVHWEEAGFQANPSTLRDPPSEDILQQSTLWPELHKLYGHGFEVYAVACNPNRTVLATTCKSSHIDHAQIILWDIATWGKKNTILGHQLTVTQIEWSPDGKLLLSVSRDRTAIIYREKNDDLNGFAYEKIWTSGKEHSRIIWSCAWLQDSKRFITVSRDLKVILWRMENESANVVTSIKMSQPITAVAVGIDSFSNLITCGNQNGSLSFLMIQNDQIKPVLNHLIPPITIDCAVSRLRFHPKPADGSCLLAYAGLNGILRVLRISV